MTDTTVTDGAALSEAEAKYFETGGESELPVDTGGDANGDGGDGGGGVSLPDDQQPDGGKKDGKAQPANH